uniref:Uncharacterized protein n=1 Tax=Pithovirus LCDPAC02 TaxID=2506601 RepID=A0A481YNY6_9VIRU|nr:MAG: hypothetical protein LCDPAC02_00190 [Pithovirus LCDPAC02]
MQICNGTTKKDGMRCKCNAKNGQYCGYHNKNNIICSFCNVNEINKNGVIQCWECVKNEKGKKFKIILEQTKKLECSDDIIIDIIIHIWNFCNFNTKLELRKLCKYTYNNKELIPVKLYNHTSKIIFHFKSSMKALRILHSSQRRPNILKYIDQLPNLEELYLPNFHLTQKFLDELPKNLEVLICNRIDFNKGFIDLSRFRNLRKLGNILRAPKDFISNLFKLEEVVLHVLL